MSNSVKELIFSNFITDRIIKQSTTGPLNPDHWKAVIKEYYDIADLLSYSYEVLSNPNDYPKSYKEYEEAKPNIEKAKPYYGSW